VSDTALAELDREFMSWLRSPREAQLAVLQPARRPCRLVGVEHRFIEGGMRFKATIWMPACESSRWQTTDKQGKFVRVVDAQKEYWDGLIPLATNTESTSAQNQSDSGTYTVSDIAEKLQCSERHVFRLISQKKIPGVCQFGRLRRFRKVEIDRWLLKG
jgi:excisionase family DNA binding protein